jgi:hypothetical protein
MEAIDDVEAGATNLLEAFDGDATAFGYIEKLKELDEDNTTIDLDGTTIGTATNLGADAVDNTSLADDITLDSLHVRTVVIKNTSGTGTALHVESSVGHAAWFRTTSSGTVALYADGSGGTNTHGLKAEGTGTGNDFFGDLSGSVASVTGNVDGSVASVSGDVTLDDGEFAIIADSTWQADTTTHNAVAGSFGEFLYKPQSASLTDADMAAIADSVWQADTTSHNNEAGSFGEHLYKPVSASVSDADMAAIADSVWQANLEGHDGVAGSFADSAQTWGATGAAGGGPRLCSLMVVDATPAAITDGSVSMTSGGNTWTADVSGAGFAVFSLTDATWLGLAYTTGYVQDTIPQTFVISASVRDTITMTAISISSPSAADKVTCYIYTYDIMGGIVERAKLTATVNGNGPWFAVDDSAAIMIPKKISAYTDSNGKAELELWESAEVRDAAGNNPTFDFILEKSNHFKWSIEERTTPDAATWKIR